ncbi:MAG: hypothetical protein SPI30_05330 [Prevotella sp.]|nr:hypothetical protein [Prevotella sp.]
MQFERIFDGFLLTESGNRTNVWYGVYQPLVVCIPSIGTRRTKRWYDGMSCRLTP